MEVAGPDVPGFVLILVERMLGAVRFESLSLDQDLIYQPEVRNLELYCRSSISSCIVLICGNKISIVRRKTCTMRKLCRKPISEADPPRPPLRYGPCARCQAQTTLETRLRAWLQLQTTTMILSHTPMYPKTTARVKRGNMLILTDSRWP